MKSQITTQYSKDFYSWALHNANLVRHGKFSEIDIEHVAEELESMGKSDRRELVNRLALLIAHFLKWQYQLARQSKSWRLTIKEQRIKVAQLLEESPSLNKLRLNSAYEQAVLLAEIETGLNEDVFAPNCPFSLEQCLEYTFLPN